MARQKVTAAPSIRRLPSYLQIIRHYQNEGNTYISGTVIAQELHLEPIQVRKDLAITSIVGKPKKGYPIEELIAAIEHFLGWDKMQPAILVGAGNLGTALAGYREFKLHGLNICAAFDQDPEKAGKNIHGVPVYKPEHIPEQVKKLNAAIAILTVPSSDAQAIANDLVEAGITAIWNFTNAKLKVPEHIIVQQEDLTSGYAMLCVMINLRENDNI